MNFEAVVSSVLYGLHIYQIVKRGEEMTRIPIWIFRRGRQSRGDTAEREALLTVLRK
jgi:hypothetical protein